MAKLRFIPLKNLLQEDNDKVKNIKSLYQREEEYSYLLGPIEHTIASYYYDNRKLKDKDIIKMLKDIKINYYNDIGYFKEPLEMEIITQLSLVLQKEKTTRHEFLLAISYILWCIDNRSWTNDNRAYLDWLLNFFGMLDENEKEEFDRKYDVLADKFGIEKEKIEVAKAGMDEMEESEAEISEDEKRWNIENSSYFAMSDDEKCDYFLRCNDELKSVETLNDLLHIIEKYMSDEKFAEAIKIIDKIKDAKINRQLREVIYAMKAESLVCLKDYDAAEKVTDELIAINNEYPMAYFNKALILYYKKELDNALGLIDKTISIAEKVDMKHPQFYLIKSRILKELNSPGWKEFEKLSKIVAKDVDKRLKGMREEFGIDFDGL